MRRLLATSMRVRSLSSVPTLWHNPTCSKSRAALQLLEERGEPFETREYLQDKPSFEELSKLQAALRLPPIEWARTRDDAWLEHFDNATIYDDLLPDDDDVLRAMVRHPIMIERPILVLGEEAIVGRPDPIRILSLLTCSAAKSNEPAKAHAALQAVSAATEGALGRGVPDAIVERSLLRMAAELHMLEP